MSSRDEAIDYDKVLNHLGYVPYERMSSLAGVRYKAARKDDASDSVYIDILDTTGTDAAKRLLCLNLERAATVSDLAGMVHVRDTMFIKDLFIAVHDAPEPHGQPPQAQRSADEFWIAAARVVQAIRLLHRREYVHAALSPYTIYWTADGPLIGELWWMHNAEGLPLAAGSSSDICALIPDMILPFLAPEQLEGEAPARESDLYALGSFFYYLICRRAPRDVRRVC